MAIGAHLHKCRFQNSLGMNVLNFCHNSCRNCVLFSTVQLYSGMSLHAAFWEWYVYMYMYTCMCLEAIECDILAGFPQPPPSPKSP